MCTRTAVRDRLDLDLVGLVLVLQDSTTVLSAAAGAVEFYIWEAAGGFSLTRFDAVDLTRRIEMAESSLLNAWR